MILALFLAAAAPQTAIDAERAFAAAAARDGQWTAFRRYAAPSAIMFVPQPTNAQAWLKDRKDPPNAIEWWPTEAWVSCDGSTAVDTGGWKRPDGTVGYFTTIWAKQPDGRWRWIVDSGDELPIARPKVVSPQIVRAGCRDSFVPMFDTPCPYQDERCGRDGIGYSADWTLAWRWRVEPNGARSLTVSVIGIKEEVIADRIAAPKP